MRTVAALEMQLAVGRRAQRPLLLPLLLYIMRTARPQYVTPKYAEIRAVSAMCSSEGITASIDFDQPFAGKIYSLDYASVQDCLYYNNLDVDTVLFSIPAHRCGTKLMRTSRNVVDQMENRVYVQMDKDTQTAADKQFSFVCRLSEPPKSSSLPSKQFDQFKDFYARPIANSISTKLVPPQSVMTPVKSTSVSRVAAYSSDAHLGNWPIPGAQPYESSMKPVPSYPLAPAVPLPQPPPAHGVLPVLPALHPPLFPTVQPATPSPAGVYPTPPRSISSIGANSPNLPLFPQFQRAPPLPQLPLTTSTVLPPPIVPNMHVQQALVVPFSTVTTSPVKVDAHKWSEAYATQPPPSLARTFQVSTKDKVGTNYREETPKVDTTFSTDVVDNGIVEKPPAVLAGTQEVVAEPQVTLEIQQGEGPFAPPVSSAIRVGENISLVVKAKSFIPGAEDFDMFVHSCFATDGRGSTRIELVDKKGCVLRREFASELRRTKDPSLFMYYYLMIKAFKFPGPDDVYFSCTIEFTPYRNVPEICSSNVSRSRRDLPADQIKTLRLFDNVNVELENEELVEAIQEEEKRCSAEAALIVAVCSLMLASTISTSFAFYFYCKSLSK
ncbi:unnamed protein product [Caenorhabditis auriculariae]|uniref:ZP domain-containing protein n=1 Tax=Caenorhabditis auriculariae TaxID=2777116 RepID=A0A8S1GYP3_9PELO|nr:unnamed protein product [Caenorhabditis auriculariae]